MKVIYEEAYAFILVKDVDDYFLTFFTGGPVEIDICVRLTPEEVEKVSVSKAETAKLVETFQQNRELYKERRVVPSVIPF